MGDFDLQPDTHPSVMVAVASEAAGQSVRPNILSFAWDWANLLTLIGLSCGILSIYYALNQQFQAAVVALLWAAMFDWFDGPVARKMVRRSRVRQLFGAQLDSLVDVISSAMAPGLLLLAYGEFNPWFYPGLLAIVLAGVLRLAHFNVFGVSDDGTIAALSIDFAPLVIAGVFLLEGPVSHDVFAALLYAVIIVLAGLHVAPFRMPKLAGAWVVIVTAYVLGLTVAHSLMLWAN